RQQFCGGVYLVAGQAVDNAAITFMLCLNKIQQLLVSIGFWCYPILNVRAIKAADKVPGPGQRQAFGNFLSSALVRCGGQGNARYAREGLRQHTQLQIVRSEVVPPLGHTVSFVDGKERQRGAVKKLYGSRLNQTFRSTVEQIKLAGHQGIFGRAGLFERSEEHTSELQSRDNH